MEVNRTLKVIKNGHFGQNSITICSQTQKQPQHKQQSLYQQKQGRKKSIFTCEKK